jgi:dynactin complex subunit
MLIYVNFFAGKNDGAVNGKRYFTCKPRYGTFVRADKVTLLNTRPKSNSSSRVIVTNRRVLSGNPGTSSSRDNSGVQTRNKLRGGSSSDDAKRKDMNRRSNILF